MLKLMLGQCLNQPTSYLVNAVVNTEVKHTKRCDKYLMIQSYGNKYFGKEDKRSLRARVLTEIHQ